MNQSPSSSVSPILVTLVVAAAVFTIGLLGITLGLRALGPGAAPSPTPDLASIPLTPLVTSAPSGLTPTPSPIIVVTPIATNPPTPVPTVPPAPAPPATPMTSPAPTPLPTLYAGPFRNNGGDYTGLRTESITVDGALADWTGVPSIPISAVQSGAEHLTDQADFAVNARVAWDDARLYVAYEVADDLHVQPLSGFNLFNGDSTELFIDTDLAGDFSEASQNGDDFEVGFSAGDFAGNGPEAFVYQPQQRVDWNQQIMVAVQRVDEGYVIEAAIPWSLLGRQPAPGAAFGLAFGAFDNDLPGSAAQQTAVAHPPGLAFDRPTTYSNLRLQ